MAPPCAQNATANPCPGLQQDSLSGNRGPARIAARDCAGRPAWDATKVSLPHCSDCLSSNRPRAQSPGCRCESLSGIATRFPIRESWPVANPCPGLRGLSLSGTLQIPFRDCSRVPYPGTVPRCNSRTGRVFAAASPGRVGQCGRVVVLMIGGRSRDARIAPNCLLPAHLPCAPVV